MSRGVLGLVFGLDDLLGQDLKLMQELAARGLFFKGKDPRRGVQDGLRARARKGMLALVMGEHVGVAGQ